MGAGNEYVLPAGLAGNDLKMKVKADFLIRSQLDSYYLRDFKSIESLVAFMIASAQDFRAQPVWHEGRRGGEALLCLTSTPACFRRSVVVESMLEGGMPTSLAPEARTRTPLPKI